jgi:SAM-dependent methyltransferase
MARIEYDDAAAAAFQASRHLPTAGLGRWRRAVARYLQPRPGMRLLDLGAGTGMWATAFTDWYGIDVIAVEPSEAMRARAVGTRILAGHAGAIPLAGASVDGAWLSTVIHHIPDLRAAAAELRRVLHPGALVLIRSPFPGGHERIGYFRFFPEAGRRRGLRIRAQQHLPGPSRHGPGRTAGAVRVAPCQAGGRPATGIAGHPQKRHGEQPGRGTRPPDLRRDWSCARCRRARDNDRAAANTPQCSR